MSPTNKKTINHRLATNDKDLLITDTDYFTMNYCNTCPGIGLWKVVQATSLKSLMKLYRWKKYENS